MPSFRCLVIAAALPGLPAPAAQPPYPPSPVIKRVEFDFSTHQRLAQGSDNWPTTWADDDRLYTAWGDGGGFGGDNKRGRVKLGVARIEGGSRNYAARNIWGGVDAPNKVQFEGKSYGMLAVNGVLYMWVGNQPGPHLRESRIAFSRDHGATWKLNDWAFTFADGLVIPTFLNFGRDYAGARDAFVYSYCIEPAYGPGPPQSGVHGFDVHKPGKIHLVRSPMSAILQHSELQYFAGLDGAGQPRWSRKPKDKRPVFEDANGVGWNLSVSYNPGLRRHVLCTEHSVTHAGKLGMFDAPEPWGPWTTVVYEENWGKDHIEVSSFYWNFPTKWMAPDGKRFTLVFTGKNSNDSWNTVAGRFFLHSPPPQE